MTIGVEKSYFFARNALLPNGWQQNVRFEVENGHFTKVLINSDNKQNCLYIQDCVVPTLANVHSHAFQRTMAGMAEISLNPNDSFWSWRDLMYRVVSKLSPEQVRIVATQLYIDLLKAGYTQVGEFHYLHNDITGRQYSDIAEMSRQLIQAAELSGIGLTLLPVLYSYSGFGSLKPSDGQKRFIHSVDSYLLLQENLEQVIRLTRNNRLGTCFHSLRAVSQYQIQEILDVLNPKSPIHIHISEQQKEVQDCLNWSGQRPVEWLDQNIGLDDRWCLIHATHLNSREIKAIARSRAVVGLCPTTEANLGDGIFPGVDFEKEQGRWGIGSDSHVSLSIVEELRTLEYGQRLRDQQRNRLYREPQNSVGDYLYQQALLGGNQACGVNLGLAEGSRADFMTIDSNHPFIAASEPQDWMNRWLFACNDNLINDVYVAGNQVIKNGKHACDELIRNDFIKVIKQVIYDR